MGPDTKCKLARISPSSSSEQPVVTRLASPSYLAGRSHSGGVHGLFLWLQSYAGPVQLNVHDRSETARPWQTEQSHVYVRPHSGQQSQTDLVNRWKSLSSWQDCWDSSSRWEHPFKRLVSADIPCGTTASLACPRVAASLIDRLGLIICRAHLWIASHRPAKLIRESTAKSPSLGTLNAFTADCYDAATYGAITTFCDHESGSDDGASIIVAGQWFTKGSSATPK